jgi:hypothetical protein
MKVSKFKYSPVRRMFGFTHAMPDGRPVLKGHASWRTVNGVWLNTEKWGWIIVEFRRHD